MNWEVNLIVIFKEEWKTITNYYLMQHTVQLVVFVVGFFCHLYLDGNIFNDHHINRYDGSLREANY